MIGTPVPKCTGVPIIHLRWFPGPQWQIWAWVS
jgi:hypothetical protein